MVELSGRGGATASSYRTLPTELSQGVPLETTWIPLMRNGKRIHEEEASATASPRRPSLTPPNNSKIAFGVLCAEARDARFRFASLKCPGTRRRVRRRERFCGAAHPLTN